MRPAVNVGLSVSRVGGAAQTKAMKKACGSIRIDLAQYREMEVFTQFSSDLDDATKAQLAHGRAIMELLKQPLCHPLSLHEQVITLCLANNGIFDIVMPKEVKKYQKDILIKDTLKITNAMYMISSSKLKKSKKMLADTEPYFYTLQSEMSRILRHLPDMNSIYFKTNAEIPERKRKAGYIVITADKGLAGSYNHNILKLAEEELEKRDDYKLFVLGELGRHYFEQKGINIDKQFHFVVQDPSLSRARRIAEDLLKLYHENQLDELYIIYTTMVNAMQEEAQVAQLLPLKKTDFKIPVPIDIPLEGLALKPSAEEVMDHIVPNYVVGFVYGALVEAFSCEQNARMMAMEGATNSAKQMLKELDIEYNRARQAAITQEITEVIAGAKSQKKKKK